MAKYYSQVGLTLRSDAWIAPYLEAVPPIVARHGGRYLYRTAEFARIEGQGDDPTILAMVEWPDRTAAEAFYADPDYQPYLASRLEGAANDMFLVPGLEP